VTWIVDEIMARGGAVPFRDFMEFALYHPAHGFYSADSPRHGRRGDYLTAPSASPWYGRTIARLLRGIALECGPLTLVDIGSGDGSFLESVVLALGRDPTDHVDQIVSVDRSAAMRRRQREQGPALEVPCRYVPDLDGLDDLTTPASGCVVHASELYDALPVCRLVAREGSLNELWVGVESGELCWHERRAGPELAEYFRSHGLSLEPGQVAEVNLDVFDLHRDLLHVAGAAGVALVLDYGHPAARLYDPRGRRNGSLACYRDHRLGRDPLAEPGEWDITAHVNWDDLRCVARSANWVETGLWQLAEFLVRAGIGEVMEDAGLGAGSDLTAEVVAERQEIKRLLDPDGMGSDLKMLVQAHGPMVEVVESALRIDH
jgi:SAM-dependent MidA family methyltransferase